MTITRRFLDSIWDFSLSTPEEKTCLQAKGCLIDYLACAYSGARLLKKNEEAYLSRFPEPEGTASVIGLFPKRTASTAALLNAMSVHATELDDGHRYAMIHLGAPVISAVLAAVQSLNLSGKDLLQGIIVGYEATVRLAAAMQPDHKLRGFHTTATCTTVGAALGIAAAMKLDRECWNEVITAAATNAAGILEAGDDGSELKPYNAGRAASAAIEAVRIGSIGLRGPSDVLGGPRGFFGAMTGKVDKGYLLNGVMPEYAIDHIYRKPYASCRHSHSAIESAKSIRDTVHLDPETISRVVVDTYKLAVKGHDHTEITGVASAKMSIPYAVAASLVYGKVNAQQYEPECLQDPKVLDLCRKVMVREDPQLSVLVPDKRAAIVTIETTRGMTHSCRTDYPLGEPENPMTLPMIEEKFHSLMTQAGEDPVKQEKILSSVYSIEDGLKDLLELL